jgi:hypothetical protein
VELNFVSPENTIAIPADRPRDMVHQESTARGRRPKLYVLAFRDGMPLHDDMALLVLRLVLVQAQGWTRDLAQPPGGNERLFGAVDL